MSYGLEQCRVCGAVFEKPAANSVICASPECRRQYINRYNRERRHKLTGRTPEKRGRYSGEVYENTPERIAAILARYKDGVKKEHIEEWINGAPVEI